MQKAVGFFNFDSLFVIRLVFSNSTHCTTSESENSRRLLVEKIRNVAPICKVLVYSGSFLNAFCKTFFFNLTFWEHFYQSAFPRQANLFFSDDFFTTLFRIFWASKTAGYSKTFKHLRNKPFQSFRRGCYNFFAPEKAVGVAGGCLCRAIYSRKSSSKRR
ncbi:MAG: hypothetical protein ACI4QL_04570 [Candidatus Fimimonas sp.]